MKIKIKQQTPSRFFHKRRENKKTLATWTKKSGHGPSKALPCLALGSPHLPLHPVCHVAFWQKHEPGLQGTICAVGGNRNKMEKWPKTFIYDQHSWHDWIWSNHHRVNLKIRSNTCEIELLMCDYTSKGAFYFSFSAHLQLYLHRICTTQSFCCRKSTSQLKKKGSGWRSNLQTKKPELSCGPWICWGPHKKLGCLSKKH